MERSKNMLSRSKQSPSILHSLKRNEDRTKFEQLLSSYKDNSLSIPSTIHDMWKEDEVTKDLRCELSAIVDEYKKKEDKKEIDPISPTLLKSAQMLENIRF
jgi:hypothetical protein